MYPGCNCETSRFGHGLTHRWIFVLWMQKWDRNTYSTYFVPLKTSNEDFYQNITSNYSRIVSFVCKYSWNKFIFSTFLNNKKKKEKALKHRRNLTIFLNEENLFKYPSSKFFRKKKIVTVIYGITINIETRVEKKIVRLKTHSLNYFWTEIIYNMISIFLFDYVLITDKRVEKRKNDLETISGCCTRVLTSS